MRNTLILLGVVASILIGFWCHMYNSYWLTQKQVELAYQLGNFTEMSGIQQNYESQYSSFLFRKSRYLDLFFKRFVYNKGVAHAGSGKSNEAESTFLEAAQSGEKGIVIRSLYNIAEYMIFRHELDSARDKYEEALRIVPEDIQAKINLELLIKKIQERDAAAQGKPKEGEPTDAEKALSDYWKREMPDQDSYRSSQSKRIWR